MKKILLLLFIVSYYLSLAQTAPLMEWQKVIMTGLHDRINDIVQTSDGGYISLAQTNTVPGSSFKCAISKIDANGNPVWNKTIGGSGKDFGKKIIKLADGNFILIGTTSSTDGDMSGHYSSEKMWVFKMDSLGNFIWKKFYNGEGINDILPVPDGYILLGNVLNAGFLDIRITKITGDGNLVWTKTYGGNADDMGVKIDFTPDSNYMVFAQTRSNNGTVTNNHGEQDAWVIQLDTSGNLLSQKTYGGSSWEYATDFFKDVDGYVFWGQASSLDGDLTGVAVDDDSDYWIFKTDFAGNILWQKKIGSDYAEYYNWGKIIKSTDNNYIAMGLVWNGYKTVYGSGHHGASDIWLMKFDTSGNILWKKCWGGSTYDYALNFIQNSDGSIVIAGSTNSQNGDLVGSGKNTGGEDTWIFKLYPETFLSTNETKESPMNIFPNPTSDFVHIETNKKIENINIFTLAGQFVKSSKEKRVDISSLTKGVYVFKVQTSEGTKTYKIIKE
ncbi:T9SS type A sorting domain-containing protein [Chryseobacterium herbae]|uniref:T9SS type A sorting domain-containing protein n=1 Tax=Chryseobacterium herbae TaxID=2976476 RepID=A0ABT2IVF4_9FLAO|nr:T9SS type A sorting domain-containing protein [Chryseobacterium sp. pc1-10]